MKQQHIEKKLHKKSNAQNSFDHSERLIMDKISDSPKKYHSSIFMRSISMK